MAHFLVIAASSGIGQATVLLLKEAGHSVFTTARDTSKIVSDAVLDATYFDAVDSIFKQAGELDGVVNCSGSLLLKSAHLTSKEQYQAVVDASLTTAFATVRAAGKHMNKGGSVVLVSSAAAMEGLANHEAIAAAKAGILGLTLSAAATYAPMNLRVNAVAPGLTETPLTAALTGNETSRKFSEAMHALGRLDITVDASAIQKLGISYADGLKLLNAQDAQGKLHVGVDAFILIWRQIPRWRVLASIVGAGFIRPFANIAYKAFAGWRFNRLAHCQIAIKADDMAKK